MPEPEVMEQELQTEPVEQVETTEPVAAEPVEQIAAEPAEPPKKTQPEIGDTRFDEIYWKYRHFERKSKGFEKELKELRERQEKHETDLAERDKTNYNQTIAELDAGMDAAAESGDITEYHKLNKKRIAMIEKQAMVLPKPPAPQTQQSTPGDEYKEYFTSQPENIHLLTPEAKGGSLETGGKVFQEMVQDQFWNTVYDQFPDRFWKEMSDRVSAAKKKPAAASPVESVRPATGKPSAKKMSIREVADEIGADVGELEAYAKKMYPKSSNPGQDYADNYVAQVRGE